MAWTSFACGATLALVAALEGTLVAPPDVRTSLCLVGVALVAQVFGWVTLATFIPRVPSALGSSTVSSLLAGLGFRWFR